MKKLDLIEVRWHPIKEIIEYFIVPPKTIFPGQRVVKHLKEVNGWGKSGMAAK